ncbi:hypothetical protein KR044_000131 [Drosophila immigrans]|nr:hypothetical protein KR044_000131 [Drosophila immigrans]
MLFDDSSVKLFDRKFVAANLRSQLRCPNCAHEYSHRHFVGMQAENYRPFLLPCGHNMCEFCISQRRQQVDFKCAVCFNLAPPTITAKDPKFPSNLRDFYELNYHVMGQANSLTYYRRTSVHSANKSLQLSEIVMETKCSECSYIVARGECKQCNAFYCKRCFDTVHSHSRVLKTHSFQHLSDHGKRGVNKGIRVGTNIFRIPTPLHCSDHKLPANIFCRVCNRNCCKQCKSSHHSQHSTCLMDKLNERYLTEIPASINSIDAAILQVNNAQMVLKNAKKKLSDFADETLTGILNHFRLLHGQLQNAELQAVEMLRESSLSPQVQLNDAMSQLNGYELVLNKLRKYLEPEVSQNIWLKEVISLIYEHLEKIPTQVSVTKIESNPYQNTIDKLSDLIGSHFITNFKDPHIEVRFSNEYDNNSIASAISYDRQSLASGRSWPSNRVQTPQMDLGPLAVALPGKQKRLFSNRSSSSVSENTLELHSQHSKFLRSFSELDIMNSSYHKSNTLVGDWFKTGASVLVRSVNSPEDFYVQSINAAQHIREQLERFVSESDCLTPGMIVVGQQYLVHLKIVKTDRWQRALVCQKSAQPNTYSVFLPDIGAYQTVQSNDFHQLPESLLLHPYASVHCSLKQLMPITGNCDWEPKAGAFLKQVVQNRPVFLTVQRSLGPQFYEVDLTTSNYKSSISVREAFLYTGLAQTRSGYGLAQLTNPQQQIALKSQQFPQREPHDGNMLMVQLLHMEHPQDFHVMWHNNGDNHNAKQAELQLVMNSMSLAQLEPIYMGRLHLACVLQCEGQWHRVRIEQMLPDGFVIVRFVDSGATQKLYWGMLFMLPEKFWHREVAIKCCLADVAPLQKHGYAWTTPAIAAFKQLASNPQLQMEVISVRDKVAHVTLHFARSGSENNNVAALLVAQGHCVSTGENSKVSEPLLAKKSPLDADTRRLIELTKEQPQEQVVGDGLVTIQRSAVEILYVLHPSEFYVTLTHFLTAISDLRLSVQDAAVLMKERNELMYQLDWLPGEMCYIWVKAKAEMNVCWHRGQIISVSDETGEEYKYNVQLRDIGELVEMVPASSLLPIDDAMARISNSALRCQLYDIRAKEAEWSTEAIEFFKAQLVAYSSLHVSGHGRDGDCLNVDLWGAITEISGPFSPARTKFVSINEQLVKAGWAVKNTNKISDFDEPSVSVHTTVSLYSSSDSDEGLMACLANVDNDIKSVTPVIFGPLSDTSFEHNDDMPPLELLEDFNDETSTTDCTVAPLAWQTPRNCKKSIFTALPTYVNHQCEIYLSLGSDTAFIKHMRELLSKRFSLPLQRQEPGTYVVGQPVVVKYHLDNQLYRGIVKSKMNSQGEYRVYYVDYGNVEKTKPSELLPFAPFPHLKAMCFRIVLDGMRPKQHKYDIAAMDMLHSAVVMKLSSIRVVEAEAPNGLPLCQVKVDNEDVVTMMVSNGMVLRQKPQDKRELALPCPKILESFKMFDELQKLGELSIPVVDEVINNTTVQPPPAKKKYVMNSQQMQNIESDEDFDCKEEALQQLQMSINFEDDKDGSGFSDDYIIECIESFPNTEAISANPESPESAGYSPSPHISAIDQVRRRIQLRNKQDRLETSHFSPMDTSTERSYRTEVGCFKAPNLPAGVRNFKCIIDKVLSATELQISPKLSEFAKHEIGLTQETSSLIKGAKRLHPVQLEALCLARYPQDNQWYRAIIKEIHQSCRKATVFYIDFHDTQVVLLSDLKCMPKELFMFPQRTFRVKLHGIKMNTDFSETAVRYSLQACLCKYPEVFARVHYPLNYHNNSESSNDSTNSIRKGFQLLEIDVFEDEYNSDLLYKPLIDSRMYLLK